MNKKYILIILPFLVLAVSVYGLYTILGDSPIPILSLESSSQTTTLSGYYTGTHNFGGNVVVPGSKSAILDNGSFIGGDIYVYGEITITNSIIYDNIYLINNGKADIINVTLRDSSSIFCYDYSSIFIENINREPDNFLRPLVDLLTFDFSHAHINRTVISSYSFESSYLNITNMQNNTINPKASIFHLFHNAQASVMNSEVDVIALGAETHLIEIDEPILFLNSSSILQILSYANSSTWMFNSSFVKYLNAWDYSIIYRDGSSSIQFGFLNDNAIIIPI